MNETEKNRIKNGRAKEQTEPRKKKTMQQLLIEKMEELYKSNGFQSFDEYAKYCRKHRKKKVRKSSNKKKKGIYNILDEDFDIPEMNFEFPEIEGIDFSAIENIDFSFLDKKEE